MVREIITGAAVGFIVGVLAYKVGVWMGTSVGYARRNAEIAIIAGKIEAERRGEDAKIQSMSDYELCVYGVRAAGMRETGICDQLRGLHAE